MVEYGGSLQCETRPDNAMAIAMTCAKMDIEDVGLAGLRKLSGWINTSKQDKPDLVGPLTDLWNQKATDWCLKEGKRVERLNDKIEATGDATCAIFDMDGETLEKYCLLEDRLNPAKSATPQCSKASLGDDVYNELNTIYCDENPTENWCACHNIVNNRCGDSPDGAGCRNATLDPTLADDAVLGQSAYETLNKLNHCRRRMCVTGMFIPPTRPSCPETFNACGKDFNLRLMKNSDVVRECVLGSGGNEEDLEAYLSGDVPDLDEALKLQDILTAKDENAAKRKSARMKDDTYLIACVICSCVCMGAIAVGMSRK